MFHENSKYFLYMNLIFFQAKLPSPDPSTSEPPEPEGPKKLVFVEDLKEQLYKALRAKELKKIISCRYCPREFKFLSEHLSHLKKHTHDVDSGWDFVKKKTSQFSQIFSRERNCNFAKFQ